MRWLLRTNRRLKDMGILGINRRNATCILDRNPRSLFPMVDDKLRMRDLCARIDVPTPQVYAEISSHSMVKKLPNLFRDRDDFVIKPNRGSGGRGILVILGHDEDQYVRHNGELLSREHLRRHVSDILSGMYSLGGQPDRAIIQQRIRLHRVFEPMAYKGIPDVRVILYRNQPAMAMLRLPTKNSNGRANLHQGGIGVGVNLKDGRTTRAVERTRWIDHHPDTCGSLVGVRVPHWTQILGMARKVAEAVGLGYLGVDIVVDDFHGPMLLEANARPGLAIQVANACGLVPRLEEIDRQMEQTPEKADESLAIPATIGQKYRRSA
jgi:alpha-L-glutamate ligase-like protein